MEQTTYELSNLSCDRWWWFLLGRLIGFRQSSLSINHRYAAQYDYSVAKGLLLLLTSFRVEDAGDLKMLYGIGEKF